MSAGGIPAAKCYVSIKNFSERRESLDIPPQAELIALHVTQKKQADYFLDLLAVMEGYPMLNPPAGIPIDRLLREKALDLTILSRGG